MHDPLLFNRHRSGRSLPNPTPTPMKQRILLFVLASGLAVPARAAIPVTSSITSVTVYQDRAIVTRVGSAEIAAGESELGFPNLPRSLVDSSLQVGGRGPDGTTILDVRADPRTIAAAPNPRVRVLEDKIRELEAQRRVITDRVATLTGEKTVLNQLAAGAAAPAQGDRAVGSAPRGPADWQQLLSFYDTGLEKLGAEQRSLDKQLEEIDSEISSLSSEKGELSVRNERDVKDVIVRVSAAQPGKVEVTISYALTDASWTPTYEARLSTTESKLSLGYFGSVSQRSGEDWNGVALTLSTARPSLGGGAPELPTWIVPVPPKPEPMETSMDATKGVTVLSAFEVDSTRGGALARPQRFKQMLRSDLFSGSAAVSVGATSAVFRIATPANIPCDGVGHRVGIGSFSLGAVTTYKTTPKLLPAAFLDASITNGSDYPLLAGQASAFLDGMFVAKVDLKTVMPGEKFNLSFGVDEGIKVERKTVGEVVEGGGFLSGNVRWAASYLITVTNNKTVPASVEVTDQIPVSRNEKIVVEQVEPAADALKPTDQGLLIWKIDLKPGEKREIPLKFTITHPKDLPID
jgi:uncharacterized protein (TIGR02231 family)